MGHNQFQFIGNLTRDAGVHHVEYLDTKEPGGR